MHIKLNITQFCSAYIVLKYKRSVKGFYLTKMPLDLQEGGIWFVETFLKIIRLISFIFPKFARFNANWNKLIVILRMDQTITSYFT